MEDAEIAVEILRFALYKEVMKRKRTVRRKKRKLNTGDATGRRGDGEDDEESDEDESDDEEEEEENKRMEAPVPQVEKAKSVSVRGSPAPPPPAPGPSRSQDPIWGAEESQTQTQTQDVDMDMDVDGAAGPTEEGGIRDERCVSFRTSFIHTCVTEPFFSLMQIPSLPVEDVGSLGHDIRGRGLH